MNAGYYKEIFDRYGGMMRAKQLDAEKVFYAKRQKLIQNGYIEKVRTGYYQWIDPEDFSEVGTVKHCSPMLFFVWTQRCCTTDTVTALLWSGTWPSAKIPESPVLESAILV